MAQVSGARHLGAGDRLAGCLRLSLQYPLAQQQLPWPACRIKKTAAKVKIPGKGGLRWYKNVGLGFKTPKEAIEGALHTAGAATTCSCSSSSSSQALRAGRSSAAARLARQASKRCAALNRAHGHHHQQQLKAHVF